MATFLSGAGGRRPADAMQGWRSPAGEAGIGADRAPCHYHVMDNQVGDPAGYRDDLFASRRVAYAAARARAQWLAAVTGLRVEQLTGGARYLLTTGRAQDAGRTIEVEECDDPECLAPRPGERQ